MKRKNGLICFLSCCIAMSLCGCDALDGIFGSKEPKTASELMTSVQETMAHAGYAVSGNFDMEISTTSDGVSFDIPLSVNTDGKVFGETSYMAADMTLSLFGESNTQAGEFYVTEDKVYRSEDGVWSVENKDASGMEFIDEINGLLESLDNDGLFDSADMTKEGDTYIVVLSMDELLQDVPNLFSIQNMGDVGFSEEQLKDALIDTTLTYTVAHSDDGYYLCSIDLNEVDYNTEIEIDGAPCVLGIKMSMSLDFSDCGNITKKDVAVPESVLKEATPVATNVVPDLNDFLGGTDNTGDTVTVDATDNTAPAVSTASALSDYFGAYNGVSLSPGAFGIDLLLDEFSYNETDVGAFMSLPMTFKENEFARCYVYGENYDTNTSVLSNPIYGYSFEISDFDSGSVPAVTFGGLTWGATEEEVRAVYGVPKYEYASDGYWSLTYGAQESDASVCDILFWGTDANGVNEFSVDYYNYD